MKAVLIFPQDGVDGEWIGIDDKGQEVSIQRMEFKPQFARADAAVPALYTKVLDKSDEVVQRGALMLSGRRGTMFYRDRSKPVAPSFDTEGAPPPQKRRGRKEAT